MFHDNFEEIIRFLYTLFALKSSNLLPSDDKRYKNEMLQKFTSLSAPALQQQYYDMLKKR